MYLNFLTNKTSTESTRHRQVKKNLINSAKGEKYLNLQSDCREETRQVTLTKNRLNADDRRGSFLGLDIIFKVLVLVFHVSLQD